MLLCKYKTAVNLPIANNLGFLDSGSSTVPGSTLKTIQIQKYAEIVINN